MAVPDAGTREEADAYASAHCRCGASTLARQKELQIGAAKDQVEELFGEGSMELGFRNALPEESIEFLKGIAEAVARGGVEQAKVSFGTYGTATVDITSKGMVRVQRSQGHTLKAEV